MYNFTVISATVATYVYQSSGGGHCANYDEEVQYLTLYLTLHYAS